jgi:V8-like Glu-specific endopeptidase
MTRRHDHASRTATLLFAAAAAASAAAQGPDRPLRVRVLGLPGEQTFLLASLREMPPVQLLGIDGTLALDPTTLLALRLPSARRGEHEAGEVAIPAEVLRAALPAQAVHLGPQGMRLSPPFQLARLGAPDGAPAGVPAPPGVPLVGRSHRAPDDPAHASRADVNLARDPRTGEDLLTVWARPPAMTPLQRLATGRRAGRGDDGPPETAPESSGMSSLSAIASADSEDWPYRPNCKIKMTFPGDSRTWGGSAVLIDPKHVLTAGHCVYDADLGGWADWLEVTPAYDEDRSDPSPYGTAEWSGGYVIGARWVSTADPDQDYALLRLDRPIGALTGWFGYGSSTSCSSFEDNTFWARSYPIDGSYSGSDMHSRSGSFDYCPNSYQTRFWLLGYGGESGSGYYRIIDDSRYVFGVLSHGSWTVWHGDVTDVVRLTSARCDAFQDFMSDARTASADLMPMGVEVSDSTPARGQSVDVSFVVLNYGNSDHTGGMSYTVRLSTNTTITTSDPAAITSIMSWFPVDSVDTSIKTATITIPTTLGTGTYYVGVTINTSDADTSNNTTGSQDVFAITVH